MLYIVDPIPTAQECDPPHKTDGAGCNKSLTVWLGVVRVFCVRVPATETD